MIISLIIPQILILVSIWREKLFFILRESLIVFSSITRLVERVWCRVLGAVSVPALRIVSDGRVENKILIRNLVWLLVTHHLTFSVRLTDVLSLLGHFLRIALLEG